MMRGVVWSTWDARWVRKAGGEATGELVALDGTVAHVSTISTIMRNGKDGRKESRKDCNVKDCHCN